MRTDLDEKVTRVPPARPEPVEEPSRNLFAGFAVASIWTAVAIASIWSPDLISGSEQEHVPIAAFVDWLYGALATGLVLMAFSRRTPAAGRSLWAGFAVAIGSIWLIVALASVFAPSAVTGTDPTTIPVAAFFSPIAGVVATAFASVFVAGSPGR